MSLDSDLPFGALLDHIEVAVTAPALRLRTDDIGAITRRPQRELAPTRRVRLPPGADAPGRVMTLLCRGPGAPPRASAMGGAMNLHGSIVSRSAAETPNVNGHALVFGPLASVPLVLTYFFVDADVVADVV